MPSSIDFTGWSTTAPTAFVPDQFAALGIDIASIPDLDPGFTLVSGYRELGEAIARRLETPRGSLWYAPDYGTDIRGRLNDSIDAASSDDPAIHAIKNDIEREAEKDQRVLAATADVTFDLSSSVLTIDLRMDTAAGPYALVLVADALTVQLLSVI